MCFDLVETQKKKVTVYKTAVMKEKGRGKVFFSYYTGMQYKVGKVPKTNKIKYKTAAGDFTSGCNLKDCVAFRKRDAINYRSYSKIHSDRNLKLVIIKMELSGEILEGTTSKDRDSFAGSYIESIELI